MSKRVYSDTTVPVVKSLWEIRALVEKFGATTFVEHRRPEGGRVLAFELGGHPFRLEVPEPRPSAFRGRRRNLDTALEHERMRLWRVMVHHVKALLVAVEEGILTPAQALLPHHVLPGGQTLAQAVGQDPAGLYQGDTLALLLPAGGEEATHG